MDQTEPSEAGNRPPAPSRQQSQDEVLRPSDEEFRLLVGEVAEYAIFRLDPAGRVVSWNKGAERIKGYAEAEVVGRHFSVFYEEGDAAAGLPEEALRAAREKGQWTGEGWRVRKDGKRFWAHVTITALQGEQGELRGFAKITRDMTERHAREKRLRESRKALRESERRYRRLFEEAQEGIAITTPTGEILDVNAAALDMLGYAREELLAMNAADLYVDPAERRRAIEKKGNQDAIRDLEIRLRRKDGREIVVLISGTVRRGPDGETETFQTFFRDVTDRRRAEAALRESEAKFRALAEESPTGIAIIQDDRFKYVNERYADIYGYEPEELTDTFPTYWLVHPEDLSLQREKMRQRIEGEVDSVRFQIRVLTKKGGIRHVEVNGRRFTYQGRPAVIGSVLDVTERKEAEEALQESEERFRTLVEEALVGIYLVQNGVYEYVNPAYARMYGCAPREMIGQNPMEFLHPSERERAQRKVRLRMSGASDAGRGIYRAQKASGEAFFIDVNGARITYRGQPALLGMAQDVTERRRLQREVLNAQEEERRRLGQDLHDGVASHFFGVQMMLSALRRKVDEDEELRRQVREIQTLVEEGTEDIRRLSRGLNPAGLTEGGLPSALRRLAENVEGGRFELAADLSRLHKETAAHLYWIAQEAVVNAQRYAGADQIAIRLRNEDRTLVLEVEDDGQGFDEAERVEAGGLGLRTMRYRADLLGATLMIDSTPGAGTRVRCHLPV